MKILKELRIRVYKTTNNIDACRRFASGHSQVLTSYGIKKVTSAKTDWFDDSNVFLIMVESISGDVIYGGARLHIKNKGFKLPVEEAIEKLDDNIGNLINDSLINKTGELCGLWNTRDMSGTGLSAILIRSGIAKAGILIAEKLNLESLYTLSAPWTINMVKKMGFVIEDTVGDGGQFEYPNPDLIATVLVLKDINTLKLATKDERKTILSLREKPHQKRLEEGPKGAIEIEYDLFLDVHNAIK